MHIPTAATIRRFLLGVSLALASGCAQEETPGAQDAAGLGTGACADTAVRARLEGVLAAMERRNPVPGIGAAVFVPSRMRAPVAASRGRSALEGGHALGAEDRFLAGSVGKGFFAALALRRASQGRLALDRPLDSLVAAGVWGTQIPAFAWITPRMLLMHTSGIAEYDAPFMQGLISDPLRARSRDDWLDVIRRTPPRRDAAGQFRYSDLNFVVLALLLDADPAMGAYREIQDSLLAPLGLSATEPSTRPELARLVTGYDGSGSMFGRDAMVEDGALIYNPQFEFGGGGFVSTPRDLARWMAAYRLGEAFPDSLWPTVVARPAGVPDSARTWRGIGVEVGRNTLGQFVGHSGYMPGYVSWIRWYDDSGVSVALQTNASDTARLVDDGFDWVDSLATAASGVCR